MTASMKSLIALSFSMNNNKIMKLLIKIFIFNTLFVNLNISADEISKFYKAHWNLSDQAISALKKREILSDAQVETIGDKQIFTMQGAALHNKNCSTVLRKLSRLEEYQNWIGFIKSSKYSEKNNLFTVRADHTLLPYPMIVYIFVKRPTKEGKYPFVFPSGIFTGLKGDFIIKELNGRCGLYVHSYWKGNKTNIPGVVIELFSETLARIGGEVLMRKSQI